jgi:hypothetical protein
VDGRRISIAYLLEHLTRSLVGLAGDGLGFDFGVAAITQTR